MIMVFEREWMVMNQNVKYITHFFLSLILATTAIAQDDPNPKKSEQDAVHTEEPGYIKLEHKGKIKYLKEYQRIGIKTIDMVFFAGKVKIVNDSTLSIDNLQIPIKDIKYIVSLRKRRKAQGRIIAEDATILTKRSFEDYHQSVLRE